MAQRAIFASILLLAACGDDSDDTQGYQSACATSCERAHECSSSVDSSECLEDCNDDLEDIGPQLSSAYVRGIEECIDEQSCNEFVLSTLTNACGDEARAKISPSDAAEALCDSVTDSIEECSGLTIGAAACLDATKVFADGPLRKANRCFDESCDQRLACVRDALGIDLSDSGS